jgi:hypothetical protein
VEGKILLHPLSTTGVELHLVMLLQFSFFKEEKEKGIIHLYRQPATLREFKESVCTAGDDLSYIYIYIY